MKVAKERKSAVLASNAIHHRVDSLTSVVALVTIAGAHVITDASWLDPVGGLIISAMVVRAGCLNIFDALLELADVSIDEEMKSTIGRTVRKAIKGNPTKNRPGIPGAENIELKDIQGIKSGPNYLVDVELVVPRNWTVDQTSHIENVIRDYAGSKVKGLRKVRFKFTSPNKIDDDFEDEFIDADLSPKSSPEPEEEPDHESERGNHDSHAHQSHMETKDVHEVR